jgi:hypothetical protein
MFVSFLLNRSFFHGFLEKFRAFSVFFFSTKKMAPPPNVRFVEGICSIETVDGEIVYEIKWGGKSG